MFFQNIFSERLRTLRKAKNLTLEQLAKEFNSSKGTFANLENCKKNPSLEMVIAISNYFNVSTDYLLGLTDNPKRPK